MRKRLPEAIELPVDYNQALTVAEAIRRERALEGEGVAWLESVKKSGVKPPERETVGTNRGRRAPDRC